MREDMGKEYGLEAEEAALDRCYWPLIQSRRIQFIATWP